MEIRWEVVICLEIQFSQCFADLIGKIINKTKDKIMKIVNWMKDKMTEVFSLTLKSVDLRILMVPLVGSAWCYRRKQSLPNW